MNINAALGPTNTGKTFYAIERMTSYQSGIIGLPLRLLTKEVFDKISNSLNQNKNIEIRGFGSIKKKINKAKFVRNPKTNDKIFKNDLTDLNVKVGGAGWVVIILTARYPQYLNYGHTHAEISKTE